MPASTLSRVGLLAVLAPCVAALFAAAARLDPGGVPQAVEAVGIIVAVSGVYLLCTAAPVYVFTLAIILTPFAGNWQQLHIPGPAAPDRLLFVCGVGSVLFRAYVLGDLPRPRFGFPHTAMVAAVLFAAASALKYHDLLQKGPGFLLLETFGILPFITFWLGPVIFPTRRERSILLVALVAMAAYLGLTTLFEIAGPKSLVFPRYILSSDVGIQLGRGRGPFVDAVANGVGLFVGAVSSAIAAYQWRGIGRRILAGSVCALCLAGTIMTLERSIWISTAAATVAATLASRRTRKLVVPVIMGVATIAAVTIFAVPGLRSTFSQRLHSNESVYDRQNLQRTATNMIEARPLLGFGWDEFLPAHQPYIQQSPNIPLTATSNDLHSVYLTYAVDLGLLGGSLWVLALLLGVGGTALGRAPPELESWRVGLVALLVFFLIGEAFVPPTVFVNASLWLWAGLVAVVRYPPRAPQAIHFGAAPRMPTQPHPHPRAASRNTDASYGERRLSTGRRRMAALAASGLLVSAVAVAVAASVSSEGSTHVVVSVPTRRSSKPAAAVPTPHAAGTKHPARAQHRAAHEPTKSATAVTSRSAPTSVASRSVSSGLRPPTRVVGSPPHAVSPSRPAPTAAPMSSSSSSSGGSALLPPHRSTLPAHSGPTQTPSSGGAPSSGVSPG
jgi:putative inorganic carbon (hco3(-)) transporter